MPIVMIVDDSKLARMTVGKILKGLKPEWEQVEAASAEAALQLVDAQHIDVAILDYNMPGKNGLALAEELRRRYPTMPMALVTANVQEDIVAQARAMNVSFVAKPATEDRLRGFVSGADLGLKRGIFGKPSAS